MGKGGSGNAKGGGCNAARCAAERQRPRHRSLGPFTPTQADTQPPEPVNLAPAPGSTGKQDLGGFAHEYDIAA